MKKLFPQYGFTIVEIIITLVIVGILAAVGFSRFTNNNVFNAAIIRDQIVALAATAQQNAFGRTGVTLTVTPDGTSSNVTIATGDSGGTIESVTLPMTSVTLSGDINDTDSCEATSGADTLTSAAPMTLTFGELADLGISGVTGSTGAVTSAVRICINNDAVLSVCVSPSGYAYPGDCDV